MKAILLINLGTPDSTLVKDVRRYLKQFLSDARVLSIPGIVRWFVLRLIILPFRAKKSAGAYQKIWLKEGSPLLVNTLSLANNLQKEYGNDAKVFLGMRYGQPSIQTALEKIAQESFTDVTIIPLFPQYSSAANGSAIEEVFAQIKSKNNFANLKIISYFYDNPAFISAFTKNVKLVLENFHSDFILFSYHGLPEQHCRSSDITKNYCLKTADCCLVKTSANRFCYRHHCFETTRLLADELQLEPKGYATAFQSRLGPVQWIKPYTDEYIKILASQGVKNLLVVSPSFVADCLETLEEIEIRLKSDWLSLGGSDLKLVPSLNGNWASELKTIILGPVKQ